MIDKINKIFDDKQASSTLVASILIGALFLTGNFITITFYRGYFDYFAINMGFYQSNFDVEISTLLLNCILISMIVISVILFYKNFKIEQGIKEKLRDTIILFVITFFSQAFVLFLFSFNLWIIIFGIALSLIEIIYGFLFSLDKKIKNEETKKLAISKHYICIDIFLTIFGIAILSGIFYGYGFITAKLKKDFYIIEENKIVLYMNDSYAIVSKCDIDGKFAVIKKNEQMKVKLDDLKLVKKIFLNVSFYK